MQLNKEEQNVMKTFTDEQVKLIERFFIRTLGHLSSDHRQLKNEELGEQIKAHLTARDTNLSYMNDFKRARKPDSDDQSPVAPE